MTIQDVYKKFPDETDAVTFLEKAIWGDAPVCPYCKTSFYTSIKGHRYHCNKCNSNFSVTVQTLFHRSKVDLRKWFYCIAVMGLTDLSLRQLAGDLQVTKDTVAKMFQRIKLKFLDNQHIISAIQKVISYE